MKIIDRQDIPIKGMSHSLDKKVKGSKMGALDFSELEKLLESVIHGYSNASKSVYHYTTLDALLNGIIPTDKGEKLTFWATNSNFMNDPEELKVDLKKFIEDTQRIEFLNSMLNEVDVDKIQVVENVYLLSFSENRDYLPMWSMYGKNGNGIVLEFDKRLLTGANNPLIKCLYPRSETYYKIIELLEKVFDKDNKRDFTKGRFFLTLDKVRYRKSEFAERKARVAKDCNCDNCWKDLGALLSLAIFPMVAHKNNAYEYENEFRLMISEDNVGTVRFRHRDGMLIPYIERKINRSALKSIIIGPTQDFERSKKSLEMFLKSRGFDKVKICQSNVPYRR